MRAPTLMVLALAAAGCSKNEGVAPSGPVAAALPASPTVLVQVDVTGFLAQNAQERDLLFTFVPNACIEAAHAVRTLTVAWYSGEPEGFVVAAEGPSTAMLRDCFERGLEWRVREGGSPDLIRFARRTYDFAPIPDTEDLAREEMVVLLSPSDSAHLLFYDERLVGRPAPPGVPGQPSIDDLFRSVPPAPIVAAGIFPPEARSDATEEFAKQPWASGARAPAGVALSVQFGSQSLSAVVALVSDSEADAAALEQALRRGIAEGKTFVQAQVNDPTEPAAWREAQEVLEGLAIRTSGRTVRVEASAQGTGLSSMGVISSALAARMFTAYAMMTAASEIEEAQLPPVESAPP